MANFNRDNRSGGRGGGFRSGGGFRGGGGFRNRDSSERPTMHQAVCDNCGKDCEVPFRPTSGKPVFCSSCFENKGGSDSRRSEGRNFDRPSFEERRMFDAVCDNCGNNCKLPFQPRGDKPVYCSNCFENKDKNGSNTTGSNGPQPQFDKQLEALNAKLDKILGLLAPNDFVEVPQEVAIANEIKSEETVEVAPKKTKKSKKAASEE